MICYFTLTSLLYLSFFFFNHTATTDIYTFPYTTLFRSTTFVGKELLTKRKEWTFVQRVVRILRLSRRLFLSMILQGNDEDRKSTRLNSSHTVISYAVFCLKKKKKKEMTEKKTKQRT